MPLVYDGVIVNYIETLHKIVPGITGIKIISEGNITVHTTVSFDQKAISPGICEYQKVGFFGISTNQSSGCYQSFGNSQMLKDLIKDFNEKVELGFKNGGVFFTRLLDCFVAVPITVYYFGEAGKWNEVLSSAIYICL